MRKLLLSILSVFVLSIPAGAADLTDWFLMKAKTWDGFQHTYTVTPLRTDQVLSQHDINLGDEGEVIELRIPLGPDMIPIPLGVPGNIKFETNGEFDFDFEGIRGGYGSVNENNFHVEPGATETNKCYTMITRIKVTDVISPGTLTITRGNRLALDLPIQEDQTSLFQFKEFKFNGPKVSTIIHHGGSNPDLNVDFEDSCFEFSGHDPNVDSLSTFEVLYYARHF